MVEKELNVGDLVVIYKSIGAFAELQEDHGGFVADMLKVCFLKLICRDKIIAVNI